MAKKQARKAAGSLQPHMLYSRPEISKLITEKLLGGVKPDKVTGPKPFTYELVDGQIYVVLPRPIYREEVAAILSPVSAAIKQKREDWKAGAGITRKGVRREVYPSDVSMPLELDIAWPKGSPPSISREGRVGDPKQAAEQTEQEQVEEEIEQLDDGKKKKSKGILLSKFALLALTSKMGCYSWNMPAGPRAKFGGTCAGAGFGFPMMRDEERPRRTSEWFKLPMKTTSDGKKVVDYEADKQKWTQWLCSGCYGLKGMYGSPLLFTMMECRRQWVQTMMQPQYVDQFITMMTKAIRMSQAFSMTTTFLLEEMGMSEDIWKVPHPKYFRIHDVGDVFSIKYLNAWFQVIRNCAKPMHIKKLGYDLPAVKFWMPTRMWLLPDETSKTFKCMGKTISCVPDNLTIRPSAAFFGDKSPDLATAKGLAKGSAAAPMSEAMTDEDVRIAETVVGKLYPEGNGWICPAALAPETLKGGGAERNKKGVLVNGACARAVGPDGEPPAPKGTGCRACWDRPDLKIVYKEH